MEKFPKKLGATFILLFPKNGWDKKLRRRSRETKLLIFGKSPVHSLKHENHLKTCVARRWSSKFLSFWKFLRRRSGRKFYTKKKSLKFLEQKNSIVKIKKQKIYIRPPNTLWLPLFYTDNRPPKKGIDILFIIN